MNIRGAEHTSDSPTSWPLIALALTIGCAALVFDLMVPLGVAGGLPYVLLVVLGFWFPKHKAILLLALAGASLTIIGYGLSPPGAEKWIVLTNRGLALAVICMTAVLILKKRQEVNTKIDSAEQSLIDAQRIAHLGSWRWDISNGGQKWSDEQFRIFGYQPGAITPVYDTFVNALHPDDREKVLGIVQEALSGKGDYNDEFRIVRADGEIRHVYAQGEIIRDDKDTPTLMTGTLLDITDRVEAEKAFRKSEDRLRSIFDNAQTGIGRTRIEDGQILEANRKMARMFGYDDVSQFMAEYKFSKQYVFPELREKVFASYDTGPDQINEIQYYRKDGSIITTRTHGRINREEGWVDLVMVDVSDRVAAEAEIIARDSLFKAFMDASPASISIKDLNGHYTLVNKQLQKTLYAGKQQMSGKTAADVYGHDTANTLMNEDRKVIETSKSLEFKQDFIIDGKKTILNLVKFPISGDDGTINAIGTIGIDVTRSDELEHELRQQAIISEQAELIAGFGHWVWDEITDTSIMCSPGITKIYDISLEKFLEITSQRDGENVFIHPDDWIGFREINEAFRRTGIPYSSEHRIVRPDGEIRWVREVGRALELSKDGAVASSAGIMYDITDQKLATRHIEKLSHAVEQSSSLVFITDTEGTIEYVNNKFMEVTGYSSDEAIGKNPRFLKSKDTPIEVYNELWQAITSGKEWRGELKDRCKNGHTFWAYAIISPVTSSDGKITNYISMHEDITEQKNIEIRERRAKEQAEIANRAKSELLVNMSHELRTPLNAIIGFSQIFIGQLFGLLGNDKYMEYAYDINTSGNHLLELINDILDVSAIEAGKLNLNEYEISIERAINSAVRLVQPRANSAGLTLITSFAEHIPLIYADERRIKQILINLLTNAVKFTDKGGRVEVRAEMDEPNGLVISIIDTGIGMSEQDIDIALSEFGQVDGGLDRKNEGTGLGLPLANSLVDIHGGEMKIESTLGQGTTVTIKLPHERTLTPVE